MLFNVLLASAFAFCVLTTAKTYVKGKYLVPYCGYGSLTTYA